MNEVRFTIKLNSQYTLYFFRFCNYFIYTDLCTKKSLLQIKLINIPIRITFSKYNTVTPYLFIKIMGVNCL